jgi:hypothetical protein
MTDKLRDDFSATASKEVASITASGPYGYVGYTMIDAIVRREIARARADALEEARVAVAKCWEEECTGRAADADRLDAAIRALSKRDDGQG